MRSRTAPSGDAMQNYWFLFWGYAVVWIGLAITLGWLIARIGRLDKRLRRLEKD